MHHSFVLDASDPIHASASVYQCIFISLPNCINSSQDAQVYLDASWISRYPDKCMNR